MLNQSENIPLWNHWRLGKQKILPHQKILEVGCGAGKFWKNITDKLPADIHLTLTDISEKVIDQCQENVIFPNLLFNVADIHDLPFPTHSFDHIISDFVLHAVANLERAIQEMKRVVRAGGIIGIATFGQGNKSEIWDIGNRIDPSLQYPLEKEIGKFGENNAKAILKNHFNTINEQIYESILKIEDAKTVLNFAKLIIEKAAGIKRPITFYQKYMDLITSEINKKGFFELTERLILYICINRS